MPKKVASALLTGVPPTGTNRISDSSPYTTNEATAPPSHDPHTLCDLPIELLHRIIRSLPPKPVFSVLPLLSRGFNAVARSAIPGCPHGEITVECAIALQQLGVSSS
ncbi:hypothetical protein M427DRAFT_59787 [Gonapodya prolifera JEL478]|uniref:F-box domain-containing protein n=1 Tax=Gonapodya prolifera (strain JEL478) TaxID=1344416 RepID=A0A139A6Y5_GONPJ|nr:hypothetical protein M427DRAFT_59787 [Gonapodya prolifera JEL478]|eukprot:KXS12103.1 hypothetical protein M427DRAFT_59787 [Gonapodya prolifera JEL478]